MCVCGGGGGRALFRVLMDDVPCIPQGQMNEVGHEVLAVTD